MVRSSTTITVIMPVFNGEVYLQEAIDSILQQSFSDFEFIIINDGSTDNSREIILSYNDERIRLIENGSNRGINYSLNAGLDMATGDYVARQDADDISFETRLQKQYDYLVNNPDIALVGCDAEIIDAHGVHISDSVLRMSAEDLGYNLLFGNFLLHSSVLFRKEAVGALGGYSPVISFCEDYELWFRLSRCAKLYSMPERLIRHRLNPHGLSRENSERQFNSIVDLIKSNLERVVKRAVSAESVAYLLAEYLYVNDQRGRFDNPEVFAESLELLGEVSRLQQKEAEKLGLSPELTKKAARNKLREVLLRDHNYINARYNITRSMKAVISILCN